ncbi:hypothetical protein CJP74_05605 [Psittacicella melopsittaci]|uniref:guanosine-3',5'-bis(diphosphate) 3'-diphosphatase n=1 Tax=Psittacicella melopsittaci TaxID=2028576 RepID=A0A3A1Y3T8_9GAMM|nr:RelA/SpoT family protein [Psittacicella melopsittaci]RIY32080.1 hypothetical protein CJP74_05605 [Psittacicella melopsittaci]
MQIDYQYFEPLLVKLNYMSQEDIEKCRAAYAIAYEGHDGQFRSSGEPYITHPVAVAGILADLSLDVPAIQAALLHDTIEDTKFQRPELLELFGPVVTDIVDGVSKLDKLKFRTRKEAEVANFRKMILAMTKDVRVVLIKLADRTHNMRTLGALRPDKQRRIAQETIDIYSALAYRLGIMHIKRELDSLSFRALHPVRYRLLKEAAAKASNLRKKQILNVQNAIENALKEHGIKADVQTERIPLYNIYKKMLHKKQKFNSILDIYRFIIVTKTQDECYRSLGIVHGLYKPVPGTFQDFIALPKTNGYQTLVTELINELGDPVEVFIRTESMDEVADLGIAQTLMYTPNNLNTIGQEQVQKWLESLAELQHSSVNSIEFNNSVKEEIFPEDIFIFTPRGKIITLPQKSTVLDFAYYIHSNVGIHAVSGLVDGKEAPLDQILKTGQTVEIVTSDDAYPTEYSLTLVNSARAKARMRQALKDREMDKYIANGNKALEDLYQGQSIASLDSKALQHALDFFNLKSLNDLYAEICIGNIISPVAKAVIDSYLNADQDSDNILEQLQNGTLMSDLTYADLLAVNHQVSIDPNSYITPDDPIVLTTNFGNGLLVHHKDCNFIRQRNLTPYQHCLIKWGVDAVPNSRVQIQLHLETKDTDGDKFVEQVVELINSYDKPVLRAVTGVNHHEHTTYLKLELHVANAQEIKEFVAFLESKPELIKIYRWDRGYTQGHFERM